MKQVLQSLKTGETRVADVPAPAVRRHHVLIQTRTTLVSAGTERMLLEFGKANLIAKARQQPDKVKATLEKIKTDGLLPTIESVQRKLDETLPMGYCNVGTVIETGSGASGFSIGDRVASNGKHAEVTCVPQNLCAQVPPNVSDEAASFTVIGAIALQGIRLAAPTLGETFAVLGLGLVGLLTVQLLRANGCRVIAFDPDARRVELAQGFGAEAVVLGDGVDPCARAEAYSRGRGVDGAIIAASTQSDEPVHQAATMCRRRGRIVLVGVTGLHLSRADFYEKELAFSVSCSYGPGRYDPSYEERGVDYPVAYVRWTAQRNFEAFLDLLSTGAIDVTRLITHRFSLDNAADAYSVLGGSEPSLGIVLNAQRTDGTAVAERTVQLPGPAEDRRPSGANIAFIGSGNYASAVLIPAFAAGGATLGVIASAAGVSAAEYGRKFNFAAATTDPDAIFSNPAIGAVVIATRHDLHADFVQKGLRSGKNVFVEKPVALTRGELAEIEMAYRSSRAVGAPRLMVGFNRRFAPHVHKTQELLRGLSAPKSFIMTVNAGAIPAHHWTQDEAVGGGRIVGEACHFIDLLRFLARAPIVSTTATAMAGTVRDEPADKATIELRFADGSIGTIHYFANGSKAFPKERLEIFCAGRIVQLSNYRSLRTYGFPKNVHLRSWAQDKGQRECAKAFITALRQGLPSPIPFDEIVEVAHATFDAADQTRAHR